VVHGKRIHKRWEAASRAKRGSLEWIVVHTVGISDEFESVNSVRISEFSVSCMIQNRKYNFVSI
jgi:hypothetical protein